MDNIKERDVQTGIEMAWHQKTNVVESINRDNSGIVYPMEKRPLFITLENDEKNNPVFSETEFSAIVSLDDNLPIGNAVGKDYHLISNSDVFDLIENSLGGTKHQLVSAGSVDNRSKVFVSVKLDETTIKAGGRETENVLNFIWGHGGKMALIARTGLTVIVCQNTLNAALSRRGEFSLSVKHTKNAANKIANLEKAIDAHLGVVAEFKRAMDEIAGIKTDFSEARKIFAGFVGRDASGKPLEQLSTRAENTVDRLTELFRAGKGNNGDDRSDVLGAFTDYYSHESSGGDNKWKQFVSSEYGSGDANKREAFDLLTAPVSTDDKRRAKGIQALRDITKLGGMLLGN